MRAPRSHEVRHGPHGGGGAGGMPAVARAGEMHSSVSGSQQHRQYARARGEGEAIAAQVLWCLRSPRRRMRDPLLSRDALSHSLSQPAKEHARRVRVLILGERGRMYRQP